MGAEAQVSSAIKGEPLKITRIISDIIKKKQGIANGDPYQRPHEFRNIEIRKKDDVIGALDFLKELAK